jgi:hypothetical protein
MQHRSARPRCTLHPAPCTGVPAEIARWGWLYPVIVHEFPRIKRLPACVFNITGELADAALAAPLAA